MKKIFCTLALLSVLFVAPSCDRLLDREPYTMFNMDDILTPGGMMNLLTGAYGHMAHRDYYGKILFLYEASKSPDFWMRNVPGGLSFHTEAHNGETENTNGNARLIWVAAYNVIRNLTILIENIDDVRGDVGHMRQIRGEAHVLRGLAYFDLMRLFAMPPLFSIPGQPNFQERFRWGVPIINTVEKGSNIFRSEVRRETAQTTWAFILEELNAGYRLLQGRAPRGRGFTNAAAAKALIIRAHLYLNNWQQVVEYGEYWMIVYGGNYSIIPWESWAYTHHRPFNSESIWELGYTTANNLGTNALNYWVRHPSHDNPGSPLDGQVQNTNIGFAKLGLTWGDQGEWNRNRGRDILEEFPDDVRRSMIVPMGIHGEDDWVTLRRFVGYPFHSVHNIPIVTFPEVILSLAEAHAMLGNFQRSAYYLSMITLPRRRAEITADQISGNMLAGNAITVLEERRRELMLMGHNYWDFFRRGRDLTGLQLIGSNSGVNTVSNVLFGEVGHVEPGGVRAGDRNFRAIFPIPLAEMTANPAMRDQQNPGYGAFDEGAEEE